MNMAEWRKNRYRVFNEKIDAFKDHPRYAELRKHADKMMRDNEAWGYVMIVGADFIQRIEENPGENIRAWLDGERPLHHRDHPDYKEA